MRCAVKGCNNENYSRASTIGFYVFPSDPALQKQWINFCCRDKSFNPKTSVICIDHFKPDDIANKLQYEMGFSSKRFLKHGAVPSIKKGTEESERLSKMREQRIEKCENKKLVQKLLGEDSAAPYTMFEFVETSFSASGQSERTEAPVKSCEQSLPSISETDVDKDEVKRLKSELELLRNENKELKFAKEELQTQLNTLSERMETESQINDFNMEILKERLNKVNKFLRAENNELKAAKRKLETQLKDLSENMAKASKVNEINVDALKTQLTEAKKEVSSLEENLLTILTN